MSHSALVVRGQRAALPVVLSACLRAAFERTSRVVKAARVAAQPEQNTRG